MANNPAIDIQGLSKQYGKAWALQDLRLTVQPGEVMGYLGPNGAGKTTTIRLLLGLLRATNGSATIFGQDAWTQKTSVHQHVAYVPGEPNLWPGLTGLETLELLGNLHGSVDRDYQKELMNRFAFDPHKKVRSYSKGNRQKITLIAALASRADLLILDEPTSGLDPLMEQVFREAITEAKQRGQTIFLSSHILEEVEALCDRVAVLRAGKLVEQGTLAELRHLSAVRVEAIFPGKPPKVDHLKGVSQVHIQGQHLSCQIQGPMTELLAVLAKAQPVSLFSREPSLEEVFLALYGDQPATVTAEDHHK